MSSGAHSSDSATARRERDDGRGAASAGRPLHEVGDQFPERNRFLQVVLGGLGYARRFEDLLIREALPMCVASATGSSSPGVSRPPTLRLFAGVAQSGMRDSDFVYFLLGGLALARSLRAHASVATCHASGPPAPHGQARHAPRELLL